jgi:hypothetical protein
MIRDEQEARPINSSCGLLNHITDNYKFFALKVTWTQVTSKLITVENYSIKSIGTIVYY